MKLEIHHGTLIDPASGLHQQQSLYIAEGKIIAIGQAPDGFHSDHSIDANGLFIIPGLVDLCARMREPGQEHKATIHSETAAAVAGGVSSICCPPDTNPVIDTAAVAELIIHRARQAGRSRLYPLAAASKALAGDSLSELYALQQVGCIAASNALQAINQSEVLRRVMEYCCSLNLCLMLYCEDDSLRNHGTAHEGKMSLNLGLPGIPSTAETVAISRALLLAEQTGVRLHICRVSSAGGVELLANAKAKGIPVSADTSIHHLLLSEQDLTDYNANCHLRPPLRSMEDQQALIKGLNDGVIDCICSDHQPHDRDAKSAPFSLTEPGASCIEHFLPLILLLAEQHDLAVEQILKSVTSNPAEILNLQTGSLAIDSPADLCLYAPNSPFSIDANSMISSGANTPYHDLRLGNRVCYTLVDGKIVFRKNH